MALLKEKGKFLPEERAARGSAGGVGCIKQDTKARGGGRRPNNNSLEVGASCRDYLQLTKTTMAGKGYVPMASGSLGGVREKNKGALGRERPPWR